VHDMAADGDATFVPVSLPAAATPRELAVPAV